jgi:hypothetical protein
LALGNLMLMLFGKCMQGSNMRGGESR